MRSTMVAFLAAACLAPAQEKPAWKSIEESLRPPRLKKYEITRWPLRPYAELSAPDALKWLERFVPRSDELGFKSILERAHFNRLLWAWFDGQFQSWKYVDTKRLVLRRNDPPPQPDQQKPEAELDAAARMLRKTALTEEEIRALPDSYAQTVASKRYPTAFDPAKPDEPFLPPDLFQPDGPWIPLGNSTDSPLALRHVHLTNARSSFQIFLRVPAGREAALEVVRGMKDFVGGLFDAQGKAVVPPPVPAETLVAIVEQVFFVSREGKIIPSSIVETLHLRVLRDPTKTFAFDHPEVQSTFRFRLRADLWTAGDPAPLRAKLPRVEEDREPFMLLLENLRTGDWTTTDFAAQHCGGCHSRKQAASMGIFEIRTKAYGSVEPVELKTERERALRIKEKDPTWGELQSLWK